MKSYRISQIAESLPIEFYALVVPCLFLLVVLFAMHTSFAFILSGSFAQQSVFDSIWADVQLFFVVLIICSYIAIRLIYSYINSRLTFREELLKIVRSAVFIFLVIIFTNIVIFFLVNQLFYTVPVSSIIVGSNLLMKLDHSIFGVYLPFASHALGCIPYLEQMSAWSYLTLFNVASFVLSALFFFSTKLFRGFILAFFIAYFIGIPFWSSIPALSPAAMYRFNLINIEIPQSVYQSVQVHVNPFMQRIITAVENAYVDPAGRSLAISTFPSMHVAWAIIIAFYGIALFWPSGVFLIPWLLLNIVGTLFTEQHYGVDVIFGVIVGIVSILCAHYSLKVDARYFKDRYSILHIMESANVDSRRVFSTLKAYFIMVYRRIVIKKSRSI